MITRHVAAVLACLALLNTGTGCTPKGLPQDDPSMSDTRQDLQLLHSSVKHEGFGRRSIIGTIRNTSHNAYQYAQIEFVLYDRTGHGIETTRARTQNLMAGQDWNFEVPIRQKRAYRYRVEDLTAY